MRYLTINQVLEIYNQVMQQSGGLIGIRDLGALESVVAQPRRRRQQAHRPRGDGNVSCDERLRD